MNMVVTIDREAERRVWAFIRGEKVEVGGMGYAYLQDDGAIHWEQTFLVPQEVSASEVDFEATHGEQVAIERAIADGVLDHPRFVWVSWHSHHTMKPYWSTTDNSRIAAMEDVGVTRLLSFVGCHDGTYELRFDLFGVQAHEIDIGQVTVSKLSLTHEEQEPDAFEQQIKDELEQNVTHKKYSTSFSTGSWHDISSTNGKSSKSSKKKSARERAAEIDLEQKSSKLFDKDERRVVRELCDQYDLTTVEAEGLMWEYGLFDCEDFLEGKLSIGQHTT